MRTLAEAELEDVMRQNVDLLSHGNANQKIRHVAQLRADLVDAKKAHVGAVAALKAAREANDALRHELLAYKPLEGGRSVRSRATGPDMRDIEFDDAGLADGHGDEGEEEEGEAVTDQQKRGPRRVVMFARRSQGPVKKTGTMLLSELV